MAERFLDVLWELCSIPKDRRHHVVGISDSRSKDPSSKHPAVLCLVLTCPLAPSPEMAQAPGEEWDGSRGTKSSSFFCSMPRGSGVRQSSAEGTQLVGKHQRVCWQPVIFPPLLHGLHLFSAWPFQQGEQFGYTLPTWQSVL